MSIFIYILKYNLFSLFYSYFLIISLFFHFVRFLCKRKRKDRAILPSIISISVHLIISFYLVIF